MFVMFDVRQTFLNYRCSAGIATILHCASNLCLLDCLCEDVLILVISPLDERTKGWLIKA